MRAGPAPGQTAQVRATARHEDGAAVIEISDTGPGVPAMVRAQLFTPFSSSSRPGGSGLGLSIAADLVRAHGGTIALISDDEDATGATFRISLPEQPAKLANGQSANA